ncbi:MULTISPECIES: hypothetical protein [Paraburkholderia]|uniref:hypothetical protein n=1 Tax=Paraburkholderia TaxID=1822464 RepID=UPI0038B817BE
MHTEVRDRASRGIVRLMKKGSGNQTLGKFGVCRSDETPDAYSLEGSALIDYHAAVDALSAIAKAVYHYHNEMTKKLTAAVTVFPLFLEVDQDSPPDERAKLARLEAETRRDLVLHPVLGTNRDVFEYQVIEDEKMIIVNMVFYKEKLACVTSLK